MSILLAREYLKKFDLDNEILEFDVSSATVELAALALNCEPKLIAKSLTFKINSRTIMIVCAGNMKIDNSKYKQEFGAKATMLTAEEVESLIGHKVGGVCPFGINNNVEVYLDNSLQNFEFVYPACGSDNSAIKLTPMHLFTISNAIKWVDVCKEKI